MPYEVLSHTADTGIEARAGSLADLVADLAAGMFTLIADPDCRTAEDRIELVVGAPTPEDLVVEVLSDLLYESEVRELWLCDFDVEPEGDLRIKVRARGVPLSEVELVGPPIKAVTYHLLTVIEDSGGWYGRVYFDV
ncbi:MAG: archease [Acidimicrobiia bacterium]